MGPAAFMSWLGLSGIQVTTLAATMSCELIKTVSSPFDDLDCLSHKANGEFWLDMATVYSKMMERLETVWKACQWVMLAGLVLGFNFCFCTAMVGLNCFMRGGKKGTACAFFVPCALGTCLMIKWLYPLAKVTSQ